MAEPREVLDLLDRGAVSALTPLLAPRLEGWDAGPWVRDQWVAGLDVLLGPERRVVRETLLGMRRAGADLIISYHAREALARGWLA